MARKKPMLGVQLCGGMGGARTDETRVAPQPLLRVELLDSRRLVTIAPGDDYWKSGVVEGVEKGTIVRIRPPAEASDEAVENLVRIMRECGAEACHVQPRERAAAVVPRESAKRSSSSARQVVRDMVAESRSDDRDALSAECEGIMQEVGLR